MDRSELRNDEKRRDFRERDAHSFPNRHGDSDRDRERFERDDWRDDLGTGGEDWRRDERSHGRSGHGADPRDEESQRRFQRHEGSDRFASGFDPRHREHFDEPYGGSPFRLDPSGRENGYYGEQRGQGAYTRGSYDPPSGRSSAFGSGRQQGSDAFGRSGFGPSGPSTGSFSGKGPKGYQRSDERIREDICDGLTEDPRIDAQGITITVRQGEVKLEGTVPTRPMKRFAEDVAEQATGVGDVTNTLRIQPVQGHSESEDSSEQEKSKRSSATTGSAVAKPMTPRNGQ